MISEFTGRYRFLSNFFRWPARYCDVLYPSVEHAYQAAKTTVRSERKQILAAKTPGKAKKLGGPPEKGGIVTLRPGWDEMKVGVMLGLLRQKFRDPDLREGLLATGEQELVEGNDWGDIFWGQCPLGNGRNNLGKLLMQVRDELRRKK